VLVQALNDAMDKIQEHTTVFNRGISEVETGELENVEIGAALS
jgi:hypothetical protein